MNWRNYLPLVLFFQCIFFQNCAPEQENYAEKVIGHWEVVSAQRGGKPTTTLQDAYFEFLPDQKAVVNLDGNAQDATYKVDGNIIKITGSSMDSDYKISTMEGSKMTLSASLRGKDFLFELSKAE